MTNDEPQEIQVTIRFKVRHEPNRETHLRYVAERYLQTKGITVNDGIIEI